MNKSRTRTDEPNILIVENSRSLAVSLQRIIRSRLGLKSDIAPTLQAAINLLDNEDNHYFLAILTLTLPDAQADQIVMAITSHQVPAIIFSNEYDEKLPEKILDNYIIDFVVKNSPSSLIYILQLIQRILKNQFIKVLLVDDSQAARQMATQLLTTYQFIVLEAANGTEALEILKQNPNIKLVIIDYYMPIMNGDELTAKIRTQFSKDTLAIIGISSESKLPLSARFLKAGANDFMHKPYLPEELFCRISQNLESLEQIAQIRKHRDLLTTEREIIETILTKMRATTRFDNRNLHFVMQPMEKTNGDLLLAARRPDEGQHILLGDFTGHGLQAAIGSPLIAEIFYDMTAQNLPLNHIANEINQKILHAMPTDMFLAAGFVELNSTRTCMTIWNCGIPDILLYRNNQLLERFPSCNLPRGIRDQPMKPGRVINTEPGDRVFLFSDGVVEEMDTDGNVFDYIGVLSFIDRLCTESFPVKQLLITLENYRQGHEQRDDISFIEITC